MVYPGEMTDSPSPVMTFEVAGSWLAVRVEQVDKVAVASRLWPVPFAQPEHLGLLDSGQELIPVLTLELGSAARKREAAIPKEQLVAILHVRGEPVGLAIDRAGRIYDRYRFEPARGKPPLALAVAEAEPASTADGRFWLVNADRLFDFSGPGATPVSAPA